MKIDAKIFLTLFFLLLVCSFSFGQNNAPATADNSDFVNRLTQRPDSLFFNTTEELQKQLYQLEIITGNIYFSGTGFPATVAASVHGSIVGLNDLLNRCGPGSRITLERCIIKKKDRSLTVPISKSLFISK